VKQFGELFQSANWKMEKHVPMIECPDQVHPNELFSVRVALGKEIGHPNTTEHHIRWISVYFQPKGEMFTHQVGYYEFCSHGESTKGANQGSIYTNHDITTSLTINEPGIIYAAALCNIHGLWQSEKEVFLF
jgi:superoxide reductase